MCYPEERQGWVIEGLMCESFFYNNNSDMLQFYSFEQLITYCVIYDLRQLIEFTIWHVNTFAIATYDEKDKHWKFQQKSYRDQTE